MKGVIKTFISIILCLVMVIGTNLRFEANTGATVESLQAIQGKGTGLTGEYFDNKDLTGLKVTRKDTTINFDWDDGSPDSTIGSDTFSVRWTGYVEPKYTETYTFYTLTDDGVRLWVDNKLLINKWSDQNAAEHSATINLESGKKYNIKMEYYENQLNAVATLMWSSKRQPKEIVPKTQLYPITTDVNPPSIPSNLTASILTNSSILLTWLPSTDNVGVTGYEIYRNNIRIATTKDTRYTDTGLNANTTYTYTIRSFDAANNLSNACTPIAITPQHLSPLPVVLNLTSYFNEDAFSYDSNRSDGNYDGLNYTYSADLVNSTPVYDSIPYVLGPLTDKSNNSVKCIGQTISVEQKKYSSVRLLGSSTNGDAKGTLRINYTDGTYTDLELKQKDWCASDTTGEKVVQTLNHRHGNNQDHVINAHIYASYLNSSQDKIMTSITLPNNSNMHILAITLVQVEGYAEGKGSGLKGEYFDNKNLSSLKLTRTDETINFDWGKGSPDRKIDADTFSVRWSGYVEPRYSQTYTFHTVTDDGVRLWVDGKLIIDKWKDQSAGEHTGTINLTAGTKYSIKMEYYENKTNAVAKLFWSSPNQQKEIIPKSQLYPSLKGTGTGLQGEYFDSPDLTKHKVTRIDTTINFDWGTGSPDSKIEEDTFSVRWTGFVEPLYSETYTFHTITDDGVKLWVDDKLIIDKWKDQSAGEHTGTITLTAGTKHSIKMEYYENKNQAVARLMWSSNTQKKEIIPKIQLYPK